MTKDVKVSFDRVSEALQVSATWCKLGAGVYGVRCSKEATKAFSKSPRFAGRDGVTIDINKKKITLTDNLPQLAGFKDVTAESLKIALSGKSGEKERAAFLDHAKKALEIWAGLTKKEPALHGVGLTTASGYQFFEELELAARVNGLQGIAFSFEGVHFLIKMTAAEFENEEVVFEKFNQAFKIVQFRTILRNRKMSLPKYRAAARTVAAGTVDIEKTEKFWRAAVKDIATRGAANAAGKCFFTKLNSKKIKAEFPAVAKEPRRVRAAFLVAILTKEEAAQFLQAKKPAKNAGIVAVTLDRKEIEQAPLSATKEKVVKALTTAPAATKKRPKSKSRAFLDASRKAVKEWKGQPADFSDFVKVINTGRKVPYSEKNCALLYDQSNGKATQVKGFQSWKAAGRIVKKGSKALVIEAPKIVKGVKKNGEEYERLICTPVCVFDISQTEVMKEA